MVVSVGMMTLCLSAPMILMMIFIGKEGRRVLFFMLAGFMSCWASSLINDFIIDSASDMDFTRFSSYYAPICEELIKAVPVFIYSVCGKRTKKDALTVGISVGVGFATLENTYYLVTNVTKINSLTWILARGFATALMHGMCTAAIAYTLTVAYQHRRFYIPGTLASLSMTMTYHSIYNIMVQSKYQTLMLFVPILTYVAFNLAINRDILKTVPSRIKHFFVRKNNDNRE